jgi:hypothetical protein
MNGMEQSAGQGHTGHPEKPRDPNQCLSPQSATAKQTDQSGFAAAANCAVVGVGVGVVGVGICFVLSIALDFLTEIGLLAFLILIPLGLWVSVIATKRFSAKGADRFRCAVVWGVRYLLIGAGLSLILQMLFGPGDICDAPFTAFLGGAIGTMCGSVGGAFRGWLQTRRAAVLGSATAIGAILLGFAVASFSGPSHDAYLTWGSLFNIRQDLRHYDEVHGRLPPATATDSQSGEQSSWRVDVYLSSPFRSDKPRIDYDHHKRWNDDHNLQLQRHGAWLFRYTQNDFDSVRTGGRYGIHTTFYKAIIGRGTAFDPLAPASLEHLPKDLIVVLRVERSETHWMEPGDLSIEQLSASEETKKLLLGKSGYAVLFADGEGWILTSRVPIADLCKFFTIEGAEQFDREQLLGPYRIDP